MAARSALVLALVAAAAAGSAESAMDVSVLADDLADPVAALAAGLRFGDERLLGDAGALRWQIEGAGSFVPEDGSISGSASAFFEGSRTWESAVLTGMLSGQVSGSSGEGVGPVSGTLGASLVCNGETTGWSFDPWLTIQGAAAPYLETGLAARVSLLAGSAVLEPGVSASLRWDADARPWIRLEPALALSWYPGIPFVFEAGFHWAARIAADGPWDAEWAGTLSLAGSLGSILLLDGACTLGREPDGTILDARAEVALILVASERGELSFPIRITVSGDEADGVSVGAGAGLRFSW
jgi:hypothetical protein